MCGIVGGIWWDDTAAIEFATLQRMTEALRHRGPDGSGHYHRPLSDEDRIGVALGHRRLAVIDVEGGAQPMTNEDGSIHVIFNGEIYNYRTLRDELRRSGHRFRTDTDTEVIVHLYEEFGADCPDRLNGMFAFAIWDANRHQLFVARDRLGEKPLFFRPGRDGFWFASELKALRAAGPSQADVDPIALDNYLALQYVPAPRSIFTSTRKLMPGHRLVVTPASCRESAYWQVPLPFPDSRASEAAPSEVPELLRDAVRIRMRSDVPLGAFLSGGIDSSLVVALMSEMSDRPVQTFCMGFASEGYDERPYARRVAHHCRTEHHELIASENVAELLPNMARHYDEPFGDSSAVPTWLLSQATRETVTVALTGDGGDELFAGYARYRAAQWAAWADVCPRPIRRALSRRSGTEGSFPARSHSYRRSAQRWLEALGDAPGERYLRWVGMWKPHQRHHLYRPEFALRVENARRQSDEAETPVIQAWQRADAHDAVACASYTDLCTYLPGDLMTKVDIASMAHGLECRQPFLDYRLVEWAARLPTGRKMGWFQGKRCLREWFGGLLPQSIWRRRKTGFGIPIHQWLRTSLRDVTEGWLLDRNARLYEYLRPEPIRAMWDLHRREALDAGYQIWNLLMLEAWMRAWHDP